MILFIVSIIIFQLYSNNKEIQMKHAPKNVSPRLVVAREDEFEDVEDTSFSSNLMSEFTKETSDSGSDSKISQISPSKEKTIVKKKRLNIYNIFKSYKTGRALKALNASKLLEKSKEINYVTAERPTKPITNVSGSFLSEKEELVLAIKHWQVASFFDGKLDKKESFSLYKDMLIHKITDASSVVLFSAIHLKKQYGNSINMQTEFDEISKVVQALESE